mgnify:CR=1 FL=1
MSPLKRSTESMRTNATGYMLTAESMQWMWSLYVGSEDDFTNPYAAPRFAADLAGVAPALVITAEFDPLRDEGEAYAATLAEAGIDAAAVRYLGVTHGFFGWSHAVAPSRALIDHASAWLRTLLA